MYCNKAFEVGGHQPPRCSDGIHDGARRRVFWCLQKREAVSAASGVGGKGRDGYITFCSRDVSGCSFFCFSAVLVFSRPRWWVCLKAHCGGGEGDECASFAPAIRRRRRRRRGPFGIASTRSQRSGEWSGFAVRIGKATSCLGGDVQHLLLSGAMAVVDAICRTPCPPRAKRPFTRCVPATSFLHLPRSMTPKWQMCLPPPL